MNLLSGFGRGMSRSMVIRFLADTARASRSIDALLRKINLINRSSSKNIFGGFTKRGDRSFQDALDRYTSGIRRFGDEGENAFNKTNKSAKKLLITLGAIGFTMRKAFKVGALVENSLVALEVLQGSAKRARQTMREAMRFSLLTPFKPTEVLAATQAAAQYNIDLYKKGGYGLRKDQNVAQILAGMGSFVDMSGKKIGMARAAHAVMRGDYRLLRQYRGLVSPAFEEAKAAGKVGTPQFTRKFIEGLGKIPQIMDMAEKQSLTVSGLWSTIAGTFEEFWMRFTGAAEEEGVPTFWANIRDILFEIRKGMLSFVEYIGPGVTEVGAAIGSAFKALFKAIKTALTVLMPVFKLIWFFVRVIAIVIDFIFTSISKVFDFFGKIFNKIGDVINAIFELDDAQKKKGPGLLEDAIAFLKAQMDIAGVFVDWALNTIWNRIEQALDAFKRFIEYFKRTGNLGISLYKTAREDVVRTNNEEFYSGSEGKKRLREAMKYAREQDIQYVETRNGGIRKELSEEGKTRYRLGPKAREGAGSTTNIFNVTNPTDVHNNLNHGRPSNIPAAIKEAY
ncbi:MAG: hypothetical protein ACFFG0_02535 [Candidatus Thorarchaeota archaeon]